MNTELATAALSIMPARQQRIGVGAALRILGLGSPIDDAIAALRLAADPIALGKQIWNTIQGRSWDQAVASAYARAASKAWAKNDAASVNDLIALIVSSAINARQTKNPSSADALNLTWVAFQKRMGIDASQVTLSQVQQKATQQNAGANILIPIAILGLILQVAVVGAVYAIAIYYAASLVNNYLAVSECDKELARLQAQLDAITAQHNQDGKPLTPDEKNLQDQLLAQQQLVAGGCTKPAPLPTPPGFRQMPPGKGDEPQPPFSPWPYVAIAGLVTATTIGVVYHKEIGDWLGKRKARG
jgi:hypothetical protein